MFFCSMFLRYQNPTKLTRAYLIIMPEPGRLVAAYSYLAHTRTFPLLTLLRLVLDKVKRFPTNVCTLLPLPHRTCCSCLPRGGFFFRYLVRMRCCNWRACCVCECYVCKYVSMCVFCLCGTRSYCFKSPKTCQIIS